MRADALRPKKERRTGLALYRQIQAEGIEPNIRVPEFQVRAPAGADNFREANLQGHLANNAPAPQAPDNLRSDNQLAQQDFQLYQALTVLKGLTAAGRL